MKIFFARLAAVTVFVLVSLFAVVSHLQPIQAASPWYVATTGSDSNDCTSPASACASINGTLSKPGFVAGDPIYVATGTYTGTGTEVVLLNQNATLSGGWDAGFTTQTGMSTIDGEGARRGVTVLTTTNAVIGKFTIQNGFAGNGGGIQNYGALSITASAIISNVACCTDDIGGGINNSGALSISASLIMSNVASNNSSGGGICNCNGTLILNNSTVSNNSSVYSGGGIYNVGAMTVTTSSINSNTAGDPCCISYDYGSGGGGLTNRIGSATLNRSTVSNNKLLGVNSGTGINNWGTLVLNNSTVSSNAGGRGEGITAISAQATVNLNSSTITKHPGFGLQGFFASLILQNTIIVNNGTPMGEPDCDTYAGSVNSLGYNLIGSIWNCPLSANDLTNVDPLLSPLKDNGGPTLTHAFLPGSPLINAGNPAGCTDNQGNQLDTDQRGFPRVGRCDIGAYELPAIEYAYKAVSGVSWNSIGYQILLPNPGANDLTNVVVTDTLPSLLSFANGSLNATGGSYGHATGVITWTGSINAGSTVTINFGTKISSLAYVNTSITNSVVINGAGETFTRTASVNVPPGPVFLPLVRGCKGPVRGIFGSVKYGGAPAPDVQLNLRFYNGSSWSTAASTSTGADGSFSFPSAAYLNPGQAYYVRYLNSSDNTRLYLWATRLLTFYGGCDVDIGDFDIANIALNLPYSGSAVYLPYYFAWFRRSATPSDSYEWNLFDPTNTNQYWYTPPLGYVGSYMVTILPAGFNINTSYGWYVGVYSPDDGYGESFYYRPVTFLNTGNGPDLNISTTPSVNKREAPPPIVSP